MHEPEYQIPSDCLYSIKYTNDKCMNDGISFTVSFLNEAMKMTKRWNL